LQQGGGWGGGAHHNEVGRERGGGKTPSRRGLEFHKGEEKTKVLDQTTSGGGEEKSHIDTSKPERVFKMRDLRGNEKTGAARGGRQIQRTNRRKKFSDGRSSGDVLWLVGRGVDIRHDGFRFEGEKLQIPSGCGVNTKMGGGRQKAAEEEDKKTGRHRRWNCM